MKTCATYINTTGKPAEFKMAAQEPINSKEFGCWEDSAGPHGLISMCLILILSKVLF